MTIKSRPDYVLHARAAAERAKAEQAISISVATEIARLLVAVDARLQQQGDIVAVNARRQQQDDIVAVAA
jgi:hypothetical protein